MLQMNIDELRHQNDDSIREVAMLLSKHLGMEYFAGPVNCAGLPTVIHAPSLVSFVYLPAGSLVLGMSAAEEEAARRIRAEPPITLSELRPARLVDVPAFLISSTPISVEQARRLGVDTLPIKGRPTTDVAWVEYRDAALAAAGAGGHVPSEAQWEYACRGGSSTLFCWGDTLPQINELTEWMAWDTAHPTVANGFGLSNLFTGEWSSDFWRPTHNPLDPMDSDHRVVKGGGAFFWPWQDSGEWVSCMSCARMPSGDLIDGRCAFRVALTK